MTSVKQIYKDACGAFSVKCNSAVYSELPDSAAEAFASWDLSNKMIGTKGLAAVLTVVDQSPQLRSLNLSGNNIASPGTKDLLGHLAVHPALEVLDLSNNDIRLGGPELVDLVKRNRRLKHLNLEGTFLRPLFVRLIDIQLKKGGGGLIAESESVAAVVAPVVSATPAPAAAAADGFAPAPFTVGGGNRRGNRAVQISGDDSATAAAAPPPSQPDRFSFGDAADDQDDAAEEEAFGNFRKQMSAVQFDSNDSGGKKVPRRATVCSEVYKEEEIDNFVPDVIEKDAKVKRYLLSLLERHDLFSHLEDYELSVAVDAMYERENSKGDTLYEIGDESDTFYVLYQGKIEQRGKQQDDVTLKKKGDTMQDLVLLYPDNSRETAVCVEDCILYTLDRQTYRCILSKASKKKRALYEGFLSTIGFLKAANLTRSEILSLADALKGDQFEAGGSLIKYGEVGETFYIICEGVVEVYGRDEGSNVIKVCEFTVGDCVGELEFINNHKCVADVKAKGFVRVAKMNRHHFEMVMGPVKDVLARNANENTVYEYYRHQLEKMEKEEKH